MGGDADKKDGKGEQNAKAGGRDQNTGKQGKDSKGGDGGGTKKNDPEKKNTVADLLPKDIWGHLPEKKRQEMDIYSKQRFLPKYEDLLRQYYRTISESDRRKE